MRLLRNTLLAAAVAALAACSSSDKTCADFCGAGSTCSGDQCVPLACAPACGAGTACQMGACVPVQAVTCAAPYSGCAACDTTGATPAWVGQCGARHHLQHHHRHLRQHRHPARQLGAPAANGKRPARSTARSPPATR